MNEQFDNNIRETDDELRRAFRDIYEPASTKGADAFTQSVMSHLPQREGVMVRSGRALLRGLAWYMASPLWMWTSLVVCIFLCRRQIVTLVAHLARLDFNFLSSSAIVPAAIALCCVAIVAREMVVDQRMQME